jgi:hypothetical protein
MLNAICKFNYYLPGLSKIIPKKYSLFVFSCKISNKVISLSQINSDKYTKYNFEPDLK